jgi:hypothetical protein
MKTISLHEPWASCIAQGQKRFETRSWAPKFKLPCRIAIHAAAKWNGDLCWRWGSFHDLYGLEPLPLFSGDIRGIWRPPTLGKVICTCTLAAWYEIQRRDPDYESLGVDELFIAGEPTWHPQRIGEIEPALLARTGNESDALIRQETALGDWTPGRFVWHLTDVEPVDPPVAATGRQRFWNWEPT